MARRQVRLTEAGRAVAERMLERHEYFRGLLVRAGVTPEVAAAEACHMEHCLSSDSFAKLRAHLEGIDARCAYAPFLRLGMMRFTIQKIAATMTSAMMTYFTMSETHSACSETCIHALPAAAPSEQSTVFQTASRRA